MTGLDTVSAVSNSLPGISGLCPFDPITPSEICLTSKLVKAEYESSLMFKTIALREPDKDSTVAWIKSGKKEPRPPRISFARFYTREHHYHEAVVNLTEKKVIEKMALPSQFHGRLDVESMNLAIEIALADPLVHSEIERLKLPSGSKVAAEPWMYGSDYDDPGRLLWQMFFYLQLNDNPQHNLYAHPLDFSCVLDQFEKKVLKIIRLPVTEDPSSFAKDDQPWIPTENSEYAPEFQKVMRSDTKPIVVTQPEGTSYKVSGNVVEWQKWKFHLGYNDREGPVLYDLTYDGRPTFYRLSICEMVVPYGDPRAPYHRKAAFDLGDFGAGACANNLQLGCDCLGVIKYFDGYISTQDGKPLKRENAICLHEQDAGIGWKHTNFRTGAVTVVRSRELVIQTILTVANYEYIFAWILDQAAAIHFEVRATGILSTVPISKDIKSTPWGISVTPGCFAPVHQHIFSLRIDPAIDGYDGTHISYEDTLAMPLDEKNPYGVGYGIVGTKIEKSGYFDIDVSKNRVVKISSEDTKSEVTGKNRAYKLVPAATQLMLAHQESLHRKRAEFADHAIWVTKHRNDELYAGSDHTNQSRGGHGIRSWASRNEELEDKAVLWHTFGFSHSPRLEDFPVMPCETLRVALKPNGFFDRNPVLDVPAENKEKNGSALYDQVCCGR